MANEEKAATEKKVAKAKVSRIIEEGDLQEVFIYSEKPYVNRTIYAPAGKYKVGDLVDEKEA